MRRKRVLPPQAAIYHLGCNPGEIVRKPPVRKKRMNLREVRNIAYVITEPVLILVLIIKMKSELGKHIECF